MEEQNQPKANKTKRNIDSFSDISAKELQNRFEKLQSKTQKRILEQSNLTLEDCLIGVEGAPCTQSKKVICSEKALIFPKEKLIIPYTSIVWIHGVDHLINGFHAYSYCKIYTVAGSSHKIFINKDELNWILLNCIKEFPQDVIIGYGADQKKAYKKFNTERKASIDPQTRKKNIQKIAAIICSSVAAVIVITLASIAFVSNFNKVVEYSENLPNNKPCYMDVLEITPAAYYDDYLYCRCTLENGSSVWMRIFRYLYTDYFNPQNSETDFSYIPYDLKYNEPVRLVGEAKKTEDVFDDNGKQSIMVFEFYKTDISLTSSENVVRNYAGVEYKSSLNNNTFVFVDIMSLTPKLVEVTNSEYLSNAVTAVMCSCVTASGETIEVKIETGSYKTYIDKNAYFNHDYVNPSYPDPIDFGIPARLYGVKTDNGKMDFLFADKDAVNDAKIQNRPSVEFSDNVKEKQKVYATITSIIPEYTVSPSYGLPSNYYVCRATSIDGKEVWVYISRYNYEEQFWKVYGNPDDINAKIALDDLVISGSVKSTDDIHNLKETINKEFIISFEKN